MAASLMTTANLANNNGGFRSWVQAAMVTAAINVAAEAVGVQNSSTYQLRHQLAFAILNSPASYLDRFAWAVAANTTVSADVGAPVSVASSTAANPSAVTTAAAHGLATGDVAEIAGHLVNTAANGTWPVTVTSTTAFTIPALGNGAGGATGTVVKQPPDADIQFAVNSDWNDIAGVGVTT
jgi:hypothetical protein